GISLIKRSVVTAAEPSIVSRPSEMTVDPTGAAPRTRLPVTTISPPWVALDVSSCWTGSGTDCARPASGTMATSAEALASNRTRRPPEFAFITLLPFAADNPPAALFVLRSQRKLDAGWVTPASQNRDLWRRRQPNVLKIALARIG